MWCGGNGGCKGDGDGECTKLATFLSRKIKETGSKPNAGGRKKKEMCFKKTGVCQTIYWKLGRKRDPTKLLLVCIIIIGIS